MTVRYGGIEATRQDLGRLPGSEHYRHEYLRDGRLFSYAHQVDTVLLLEPRKVLEIGVGTGLIAAALRHLGIEVVTLDAQEQLSPSLVASVTDIPLADGAVDVSLCCQVLEHLPFSEFEGVLRELRRVTVTGLVLSLPDVTRGAGVMWSRPPRKRPRLGQVSWPRFRPPRIPTQRLEVAGHYWEIGYRGFSLRQVSKGIRSSGWNVERSWRVFEKPWHRLFFLRPL
jgi:SAM-dependent methyltransferase